MQGNSNFERNARKERNARPPRGEQAGDDKRPGVTPRGRQWSRETAKRDWNDSSLLFATFGS